ncbi:hypothetical protein UF75_3650 [Desulfosporosinus sp. I2]|nr:hypothetical protein UF75_3650 [Desulfosporosinus sp. I2]
MLERLLELGPDQIIYVSCDSGTLARDLGILQSGGYRWLRCSRWIVSVDGARRVLNSAILGLSESLDMSGSQSKMLF